MTRNEMKNKIVNILEDIEPWALDDSDLHIPQGEIEKAAEAILKLWEAGYTWELK